MKKYKNLFLVGVLGLGLSVSSVNASVSPEGDSPDNIPSHKELNDVYRAVMGREMNSGDNACSPFCHNTISEAIDHIKATDEYDQAVDGFVDKIYEILLGRIPDQDGKDFWKTRSPLEIFRGIGVSQEYENGKNAEFHLVKLKFFDDENLNGEKDLGEEYIPNQKTRVLVQNEISFEGFTLEEMNKFGAEYLADGNGAISLYIPSATLLDGSDPDLKRAVVYLAPEFDGNEGFGQSGVQILQVSTTDRLVDVAVSSPNWADINMDGNIDCIDLVLVEEVWNKKSFDLDGDSFISTMDVARASKLGSEDLEADFNKDGVTDNEDIVLITTYASKAKQSPDFDGDGFYTIADTQMLAGNYSDSFLNCQE